MINKVKEWEVNDLFICEGYEYCIESFPTKYSVIGIRLGKNQDGPSRCKVSISKIERLPDHEYLKHLSEYPLTSEEAFFKEEDTVVKESFTTRLLIFFGCNAIHEYMVDSIDKDGSYYKCRIIKRVKKRIFGITYKTIKYENTDDKINELHKEFEFCSYCKKRIRTKNSTIEPLCEC